MIKIASLFLQCAIKVLVKKNFWERDTLWPEKSWRKVMGEFIMYLIAFNQTHSTFKISTNEKQFNFKCTIWCSLLSKCLSSISLQNYSLKREHLYFVHVVLFIQDFLQDLILIKIFCDDIWNWHTHTHFF